MTAAQLPLCPRRSVIDYLKSVAPGHCYAGAMSPPAAQQVISALMLMRGQDGTTRGPDKIARLHENSNYFRRGLLALGCNVLGEWNSPVMVRSSWPRHARLSCIFCPFPVLPHSFAGSMLCKDVCDF